MGTNIALFNPFAGCGSGEKQAHRLDKYSLAGGVKYVDITSVEDYRTFFETLAADDEIIVCGGDGTLHRFINATDEIEYMQSVYYFACGTGNDFLRDIGKDSSDGPVCVTEYIKNLPKVTVLGKTYKFLNNVGFGIDGYCTQVGDELREAGEENINYAAIAVKGLLGGFHRVRATVNVDGQIKNYKNVWLVPTMKGRFYGGGMKPTPEQDRNSENGEVSLMVYHTYSKLKALMVFPSIFQGAHIKHTGMVEVLKGHNIYVKFDRPCPLQIDGETIVGVTEYTVSADCE